jgi:hypothetical protein
MHQLHLAMGRHRIDLIRGVDVSKHQHAVNGKRGLRLLNAGKPGSIGLVRGSARDMHVSQRENLSKKPTGDCQWLMSRIGLPIPLQVSVVVLLVCKS